LHGIIINLIFELYLKINVNLNAETMYILNITTTDLRTNEDETSQTIKTASLIKMKSVVSSFLENENIFIEAFRLKKHFPKLHPISGRVDWEVGGKSFNATACLAEINDNL
jgi:hypothetical protein